MNEIPALAINCRGNNAYIIYGKEVELTKEQAVEAKRRAEAYKGLVDMIMEAGEASHFVGAVYSGMPVSKKAERLLEKALAHLQPICRYVYDVEQALKEEKP